MCKDLVVVFNNTHFTWMGRGDFNTIIDESEKMGGLPVSQLEVEDFVQCISSWILNVIKFSRNKYTLWNGITEAGCIFEWLDRFFGSNDLTKEF